MKKDGKVYYHLDGMGSALAYTDETGATIGTVFTDIWGDVVGKTKELEKHGIYERFTTYTYDEVFDLHFAVNRFLDSKDKRFTQEDPVKDGVNWYGYVRGNPLKYTDPEGLMIPIAIPLPLPIPPVPIDPITGILIGIAAAAYLGYQAYQYFKSLECEDDNSKNEYKQKKKVKGKQKDDIPDRFKGEKPKKGESGKDAAKRVLEERGEYDPNKTGPGTDFNKLKKYFDTQFE